MTRLSAQAIGAAAITEAILFNVAFAALAAKFNYPDVLRRPAGEVLDAFVAGGDSLVLTWYAFALSAVAMAPLTLALALSRGTDALRISAAVLGALAGTVQAIGLMRWVFAVPMLARLPEGREVGFVLLNQWGGVAIGEHLGYIMTAGFLIAMALADRAEGALWRPVIGVVAALLMVVGSLEGVAAALGRDAGFLSLASIGGYLGLSAWLALSGLALMFGRVATRKFAA